ncbi:MAG: NUDIX hydrolase [Solobacterium sp.]|nr:NUDIX hydrolase [Solobacterium sp.]
MDLKEKPVEQKYLFRGKIINLRTDRALAPDGCEVYREVVEHPGGVGIALEDEEGKFFFVTQYRYAQEGVFTEYPAGKKEPGEDPLETAKREIIEETGYEGKDFVYLGKMVPTPAYVTEVLDMYYARQGEYKGQHLDEDEKINLSKMTLEEVTEKIVRGEITDAKTITMTFLIREYKERHHEEN